MRVPCWCGGSNENCAFCGGSGFRAERIARPRVRSVQQRKRPTSIAAPDAELCVREPLEVAPSAPMRGSDIVRCAICGVRVTRRKLKQHREKNHKPHRGRSTPRPEPQPVVEALRPEPQPVVEALRPSVLPVIAPGLTPKHSENLAPGWSRCAVCGCLVSTKRLDHHLARVHGRKRDKRGALVGSSRQSSRSPNQQTYDKRSKPHRRMRMDYSDPRRAGLADASNVALDATTGTHVFRDHGQFGSAPSYDDMSDESRP